MRHYTDADLVAFSEALEKIVDGESSWLDKAGEIIAECNNSKLGEFLSWFTINDKGDVHPSGR